MRDLISSLFITLDGVIEDPHSWNPPYYNQELSEAVQSLLTASGTHLYGRRSYAMFRSVFTGPGSSKISHAQLMNEMPKVLVSRTSEDATWGPTTVVTDHVVARIRELKTTSGKTINVQASGTLVTTLLKHNLLDELHLFVHPVLVGSGKRLFENGDGLEALRLIDARPFSTGVVWMRFAAGHRAAAGIPTASSTSQDQSPADTTIERDRPVAERS